MYTCNYARLNKNLEGNTLIYIKLLLIKTNILKTFYSRLVINVLYVSFKIVPQQAYELLS